MSSVPNLSTRIPEKGFDDDGDLLDAFLGWVSDSGFDLYPAQEEAVLEVLEGHHVVLSTPTGSGKSMVGVAALFRSLARCERGFWTAPVKALVNEKFLSLCKIFGAESVGLMTGDGAVNAEAPVICCTAEVLSAIALREGTGADVGFVVMDEFHYYSDPDRGMAWQLPLLTLPQSTFLLMSATLGDTTEVQLGIEELTGREVHTVTSTDRPIPLDYRYSIRPLPLTIHDLTRTGLSPVYIVQFTQRSCAEQASALMSTELCDKAEKRAIKDTLKGEDLNSPYGKDLRRYLEHGVGLHHAGLLPRYRLLVERLAREGRLKVICGTDTLGVGVNVPIRTVLLSQLCKFDGHEVRLLSSREFHQIAGRAGRAGYDVAGTVICQAPQHVIDNEQKTIKAAGDPKKLRKLRKASAPTRGYKHWDEERFEKIVASRPEALTSTFDVDHGLLMALLQRAEELGDDAPRGGGYRAMLDLIARSHTGDRRKKSLRSKGKEIFQGLRRAGLVTVEPGPKGARVRVDPTLQADFSLHHSLSLFLQHALAQLDANHPDHAFQVITIVESILEHPRVVLYAQAQQLKKAMVAALKAAGVDYEERKEKVDEVTWPQPMKDWIYETFNAFAETHPWLAEGHIRPKSVLGEMAETYQGFREYIVELGLQRSEGVLLRYLGEAYRTLLHEVPDALKSDELREVEGWLRLTLSEVDDSLLREWERHSATGPVARPAPPPKLDPSAVSARARADLHAMLTALAEEKPDDITPLLHPDSTIDAPGLIDGVNKMLDEGEWLEFAHDARLAGNTRMRRVAPGQWTVSHTLLNTDGEVLGGIDAVIEIEGADVPSGPILQVHGLT